MKAGTIELMIHPGWWTLLELSCVSNMMEYLIPKLTNAWLLCQNALILTHKGQLQFESRYQKLLLIIHSQGLEKEWLKYVLWNSVATNRFILDILLCKELKSNGVQFPGIYFSFANKNFEQLENSAILLCVVSDPSSYSFCWIWPHFFPIGYSNLLLKTAFVDILVVKKSLDKNHSVQYLCGSRWNLYIHKLQRQTKTIIKGTDWLCFRRGHDWQLLDGPNTHRLLELYFHTIPSFGNTLSDLDFTVESNHQRLKTTVSKQNGAECHIVQYNKLLIVFLFKYIHNKACSCELEKTLAWKWF